MNLEAFFSRPFEIVLFCGTNYVGKAAQYSINPLVLAFSDYFSKICLVYICIANRLAPWKPGFKVKNPMTYLRTVGLSN